MARPSKGLRARLTTRVPENLADQVQGEADRRGITVNDWLLWAIRHSLPASHNEQGYRSTRDRIGA